jgi:hypothetical protein
MQSLPKICIIGAGSSGIAACKALNDAGIPFDCFEKGSEVGGNWVFKNDNGMSNIYKSLHINTHRERMSFRDYPMPESYPDYPNHSPILDYFIDYVNHFGFRNKIRFKTSVEKAELTPEKLWKVETSNGETIFYDGLIVANGHHWSPRYPSPPFPGVFKGKTMHSHDYVDPEEPLSLTGKRVVVLGMGNSAMDIAVELSRPGVAKKVFLAARRGAYVIPNYLFGKPLDKLTGIIPPWIPFKIQQFFAHLLIRYGVGKMENFGLPKPDHTFGSAHPTISQDLLVRLGRGDIIPKPNIQEFNQTKVVFEDGSVEEVDAIVYCTGYDVKFPFFDKTFIEAKDNYLPLYFRMMKPEYDNLFFLGLMQPLGAIMPLAEAQSKWIAQYLTGDYRFPDQEEMISAIEKYEEDMRKRYVASSRHTMQVDFDIYLWKLSKEIKTGQKRAKKVNHNLPLSPRAQYLRPIISQSKQSKNAKKKKIHS